MLVSKKNLLSQSRQNLILNQARFSTVKKDILKAFTKVDRIEFVPINYSTLAYSDSAIACDGGVANRYMLPIPTLASALDCLNLVKKIKVLVVGGNYGYTAAILSVLGLDIYVCEPSPTLFDRCLERLKKYSVKNIVNVQPTYGMPNYAPFDIIFIEISVMEIPMTLIEQLKEGGQMVVCRENEDIVKAVLYKKQNGILLEKIAFITNFPRHTACKEHNKFNF